VWIIKKSFKMFPTFKRLCPGTSRPSRNPARY
jgi:hypothetical protein